MPTVVCTDDEQGMILTVRQGDRRTGSARLRWVPVEHELMVRQTPHLPYLSDLDGDDEARAAIITEASRLVHERGGKALQLVTRLDKVDGFVDWEFGTLEGGWNVLVKTVTPGLPGLDAWVAWHPAQVAELLAGCPAPWCVAAGWAIELHLGRAIRSHSDLEIAIPRGEFAGLKAYLQRFDLHEVGDHQVWVCDNGKWRMDIFLEPGDAVTWVSHRDASVRVPMAEAIAHTPDGIPYLRPELVLLSKAKHARPKDEVDLRALLPTLDPTARAWLFAQIERLYPGHAWLS